MQVCPRCAELYPDEASNCPRDASPLRKVLDPLIGKTVGGRFRLIQRLGSGGMSSVYLARHVLIDRLMAIKTLRRDLSRDAVQRDRFLREARAVNRINHENIVEISDFGETEEGLVYLVMEYVPGEPLLRLMGEGPFAPVRALNIAEQCASALSRAHQMGVIHRDLKPENILIVQRKDRQEFVKLLDFGIAKILDAPSLTGSQQIFGTPGYIAPEYIQSTDIDGRSDLYSLGCILYELITGALPFDYEYPGDLLVKHVTETPIRPSDRLAGIAPPVEEFILRCLEKNPFHRFRDAFHFNAELRALRERLGPEQSWGTMSSDASELGDDRAPVVEVSPDRTTADLFDGIATALGVEPDPTPVDGTSRQELPTVPEGIDVSTVRQRSELFEDGPAIPQPPPLDGAIRPHPEIKTERPPPPETSAHPRNPAGLLGAVRWRERHDAILEYLSKLQRSMPAPAEVEHAMGFAASTLEELESAVKSAQAYQEAVEALHDRARDFRSTLGRALDEVAEKLSAERGVFEALVARRNALRAQREAARVKLRRGAVTEGEADALLWELAAVEEELRSVGRVCDELESQLADLSVELESRNENFETERAQLVRVLDAQMLRLEGTAGALRQPLALAEAHLRAHWIDGVEPGDVR